MGLDYFCHEVAKTSQNSQQVVYEDPIIELEARISLEIASQFESALKVEKGQEITTESNSVVVNSQPTDVSLIMETVQKYSDPKGGITRITFKQDLKVV